MVILGGLSMFLDAKSVPARVSMGNLVKKIQKTFILFSVFIFRKLIEQIFYLFADPKQHKENTYICIFLFSNLI